MYTLMLCSTILATLLIAVWLFLFLRYSKKYSKIIDSIDGKVFTMKDLYFIGLGMIDIYEHSTRKKITTSDKAITQSKKLAEVFGRDNGELYYYITVAAKISLILTFLPIGLMVGCMLKSALGFFAGLLLAIVFPYGVQSGINSAIANKKDAILAEFPKMVSKLTLLVNAGMLLRRAWDEVAESNEDDALYAEMRTASQDILEGMTIEAAMDEFATRCGLKEIRKFSSIYVQAVKRGAGESIDSMKIMADEAWEQKKQLSKQKGELAAQKLLVPNMIMFLGIMLDVVGPMVAAMLGKFNA
ncbi:MAG: type II secretion system F family protein [Oscillospiraceae bacterium]|nr:type II secretion system F family protein [Oscillospiraceae bacterium]MBR5363263.1 type II secretion system F family protein [Oscillospiraceae bacterium]